MPETNGV